MAGRIAQRLAALGITLPTPAAPIANYVPYVVTGKLVVISGQIPLRDGAVAYAGKVSETVTPDQAKDAARLCFVNLLAQLQAATATSTACAGWCASAASSPRRRPSPAMPG